LKKLKIERRASVLFTIKRKTFNSKSRGEQSNFIELGINVLANVDTELVIKPKENSS